MAPRLKELYTQKIAPGMREHFKYENVMEVPRLEKIVINMGVGDGPSDPRLMENAMTELAQIAGQKPCMRKARRSISSFKLRAGTNIACMVTLRGARMYEFMDRFFNVAVPRIRDFRGLSPNSFDPRGNYTIGLREQTIFPEVNIGAVTRVRGMNITFVVKNSNSLEESRELLRRLGLPFRSN
ncbi:MAG: 50S ribosomal protein L5 [Candidatus Hydrogenedentes bacterium]|nr:50S ribosomal protein L5 [Candidatus Hydrogenedentota bacterium]